jgi:hypothetical protein
MNEPSSNPAVVPPCHYRRTTLMTNAARFAPGQIVATPGALALLECTGFSAVVLLSRHLQGDWGDLCDEDRAENDFAAARRLRILSCYRLVDVERLAATPVEKRSFLPTIWIITEADRSITTLLRPDEY